MSGFLSQLAQVLRELPAGLLRPPESAIATAAPIKPKPKPKPKSKAKAR